MATLVSPGVSVTITDESQYASSGQGTIPLIIIATAANKASPIAGGGTAPYTSPAMANQLYLATSQQDLIQNFGNPKFYTSNGTPLHGYELNEYGLWTAWSYLGIATEAYVLRADIDLAALLPNNTPPSAPPAAGTYWFNLTATKWGVFRANGNALPGAAWNLVTVLVAQPSNVDSNNVPLNSWGSNGNVAVVPLTASNYFYENVNGTWYRIGTSNWQAAHPTVVTGTIVAPTLTQNNAFSIDGTTVTMTEASPTVTSLVSDINAAAIPNISASKATNGALVITNTNGGSITLANVTGTPLAALGLTVGTVNGVSVTRNNNATYPDGSVAGSIWVKGNPANNGAAWNVQYYNGTLGAFTVLSAPFYPFNSTLVDGNSAKDTAALAALTPAVGNVYIGYDINTGDQQIRRWTGSVWQSLVYEAEFTAPTQSPTAGTLWYSTDFQVDIMCGNGEKWLGYRNVYPATDPNGAQISGSAPTTQSDGFSALVDNDLWIDSTDLEHYPMIYRWSTLTQTWNLIDNTDNTTPFGIVFADARQDTGPIAPNGYTYANSVGYSTLPANLAVSDYVDPDAPDPRTFPAGLLMFNTRYATYNVKSWTPGWFKAGGFETNTDFTVISYNGQAGYNVGVNVFPDIVNPDRWVTASGNATNGAPYMGRKAQRIMIVTAMAATVNSNEMIRSEIVYFNLMAAPGYPELIADFNQLNTDMNNVAFCVGDTPARLASDGTSILNWANNAANAATTGEDGLTVSDSYTGIYYPWGLGTNLDGTNIMIPPSAIGLATIAYNDSVAYPWYAPAGFRRGLVTNAQSVGYLSSSGEYTTVILNKGQRDVLYTNRINPIAYIPNRGLVVDGQKTLDPMTSALDRINVARLMNQIAYNLDVIMKPFLFEPNTNATRSNAAVTVSNYLNHLVTLNGLYDYAVVCDTTNNTPQTIDANELWVDVAVQPVKDVEFIYVPVRILATQAS